MVGKRMVTRMKQSPNMNGVIPPSNNGGQNNSHVSQKAPSHSNRRDESFDMGKHVNVSLHNSSPSLTLTVTTSCDTSDSGGDTNMGPLAAKQNVRIEKPSIPEESKGTSAETVTRKKEDATGSTSRNRPPSKLVEKGEPPSHAPAPEEEDAARRRATPPPNTNY